MTIYLDLFLYIYLLAFISFLSPSLFIVVLRTYINTPQLASATMVPSPPFGVIASFGGAVARGDDSQR